MSVPSSRVFQIRVQIGSPVSVPNPRPIFQFVSFIHVPHLSIFASQRRCQAAKAWQGTKKAAATQLRSTSAPPAAADERQAAVRRLETYRRRVVQRAAESKSPARRGREVRAAEPQHACRQKKTVFRKKSSNPPGS